MTKLKRGQVLLIAVMLVATTLTVVLSLSFQSTTETQITKLEEESQKALAAAEAGIEAALKQGSVTISSLPGLSNFTGKAEVQITTYPQFITPLLQKDEQYTFYLSRQGPTAPQQPDFTNLISQYNNTPLTICSTTNNVALELTLIKGTTPPTVKRFSINPPGNSIIQNGTQANNAGTCPSGENFSYRHWLTAAEVGNNNLLLIVRMVNGSGKVGFTAASGNLPLQGKTIISEVKSASGVSKKVQLFQSYPQIPAEFFITTF